MALGALKTWIAGEVLTAADLNAEFANIYTNGSSLITPITGTFDFDGNEVILDADGDTSITADTDDQIDFKVGGQDRAALKTTGLELTEPLALLSSELTISSGSVAAARGRHTIDTESDASSDDLDFVTTAGVSDGSLLALFAANSGRQVTARHDQTGAGGIIHPGRASRFLSTEIPLLMMRNGADWYAVNDPTRHNYAASVAPTVNDDLDSGYDVGSLWIDTTNLRVYICRNPANGAADWLELGSNSTLGTSTSLSSTSVTFSGIPSGVNVLAITISAASHNSGGTEKMYLRLGDSGGIETTGYSDGAETGTAYANASGTAFNFTTLILGSESVSGCLVLVRRAGNVWTMTGSVTNAVDKVTNSAGSKELSAELTQCQLTLSGGSWDNGAANFLAIR